jgi:hypothetical protein
MTSLKGEQGLGFSCFKTRFGSMHEKHYTEVLLFKTHALDLV